MVKGIEIFRQYFKNFEEQYVLIGGVACDIVLEENASAFRATKDLDIVLIVEAFNEEFGKKLWQFIEDGGYQNRLKSNGKPQFYRFDKPKNHTKILKCMVGKITNT